jgi:hypothetical protein
MAVVANVVTTGGENVFLPAVLGRVDTIIGRQDAGAMIDSNATQPVRLGPTHQSPEILADQQVEFATAQESFDLRKLGAIKPFAFAYGSDYGVFDWPWFRIHFDDNLFPMILLIFEAHLLLVRATADACNDTYL